MVRKAVCVVAALLLSLLLHSFAAVVGQRRHFHSGRRGEDLRPLWPPSFERGMATSA